MHWFYNNVCFFKFFVSVYTKISWKKALIFNIEGGFG